MNEQADNTQIAADLAAAEAEQTAASAAPVTEVPTANAPLRGVRAQVVEMVNQVKSLSQQLEQERTEREALADQAVPAVAPAAAETAPLTFDSLLDSMEEPHRDVIEKHIVGLRTALDKEREERKAAQKAVRTTQAEVEQLPTLRQQLEQAAQDAIDARAQ